MNVRPAGTARPWVDSASPSASGAGAEVGAETGSALPRSVEAGVGVDDAYFADSPALDWADNADGIVEPAAMKLGSFSKPQVAAGYAAMKELLTAGNLDATILGGGPLADFTDLLDPISKLPADLERWTASPSYQDNPVDLVTRFDPATTRLLGHTVKVSGSMTAALDKNRDLLVTGDYRFVYAVGPADGTATPSRAVVHRVYQISIGRPGEYVATKGKLWLAKYASELANSACFEYNGYVNPAFGGAGGAKPGKTVDPYASSSASGAPGSGNSPSPQPTGSPTECDSVSRL